MGEEILIVKKDKERIKIKAAPKVARSFSPYSYMKTLNPKDYNDLAILFSDLNTLLNSPIEKAYKKYRENKGKDVPFF